MYKFYTNYIFTVTLIKETRKITTICYHEESTLLSMSVLSILIGMKTSVIKSQVQTITSESFFFFKNFCKMI